MRRIESNAYSHTPSPSNRTETPRHETRFVPVQDGQMRTRLVPYTDRHFVMTHWEISHPDILSETVYYPEYAGPIVAETIHHDGTRSMRHIGNLRPQEMSGEFIPQDHHEILPTREEQRKNRG